MLVLDCPLMETVTKLVASSLLVPRMYRMTEHGPLQTDDGEALESHVLAGGLCVCVDV